MPKSNLLTSALLVLSFPLAAVGCSHVKPYEREYLTRPGMDTSEEAFAASFEGHVDSAREGAVGGHSSADSSGGGCGCN